MHRNAIDVHLVMFVAVHCSLRFAPVVGIEPVVNEFLKVGSIDTVIPVVIASAQRPSGALQPCAKVGELFVRDMDQGGLKWKRGAERRGSFLACRHNLLLFLWALRVLSGANGRMWAQWELRTSSQFDRMGQSWQGACNGRAFF